MAVVTFHSEREKQVKRQIVNEARKGCVNAGARSVCPKVEAGRDKTGCSRANQVSSSEDPILVGRRCGETALGRGEVCVH